MIEAFISSRNKYNTPAIALIFNDKDHSENNPSTYREYHFNNSLELDLHHHHLLRSTDDQEVLLGLYSVVYWHQNAVGTIENTNNKPITQAQLSTLAPSITSMGANAAAQIVRNSIVDLEQQNFAHALAEISKLLHGRLSLGSTFLAFIDPENIGIFDDRITEYLTSETSTYSVKAEVTEKLSRPQTETLGEAPSRFDLYCKLLAEIKSSINMGRIGWQDTSGSQMARFRSIDVQRALLQLCTDSSQTPEA